MPRNESVVRAFEIIEYIAQFDDWVSLRTLARDLHLGPATAYRFLATLKELGYMRQHPEDSGYRLSLKFAWLGSRVLEPMQLRSIARPWLEQLTSATNETTHLAVQENNQIVYLEKIDNNQAMQMRSRVGSRGYVHSTAVGKACLAFLPQDKREAILDDLPLPSLTRNTITDLGELRQLLELIRQRGYSVDDEENEMGIRCVGAPVFNHMGEVVGAVSISGWTITVTQKRIPKLAILLQDVCRNISHELGYQDAERLAPEGKLA